MTLPRSTDPVPSPSLLTDAVKLPLLRAAERGWTQRQSSTLFQLLAAPGRQKTEKEKGKQNLDAADSKHRLGCSKTEWRNQKKDGEPKPHCVWHLVGLLDSPTLHSLPVPLKRCSTMLSGQGKELKTH